MNYPPQQGNAGAPYRQGFGNQGGYGNLVNNTPYGAQYGRQSTGGSNYASPNRQGKYKGRKCEFGRVLFFSF